MVWRDGLCQAHTAALCRSAVWVSSGFVTLGSCCTRVSVATGSTAQILGIVHPAPPSEEFQYDRGWDKELFT